jgi:DNA-binding transcriptional regulator YhcF (GntR family)
MAADRNLTQRLRDRIVGDLHIGRLKSGDRLPSYRELSREWEVDHRAVARSYRSLAAEGLVEIRGSSGVYLVEQERVADGMLPETIQWLAAEVLTGAWRRRIRFVRLPEYIRRCTARVRVRCACVESTIDHRTILCTELRQQFGFDTRPVDQLELPEHSPGTDISPIDLTGRIRAADLLVTTAFHGPQVRAIGEALGKRVVVVSLHSAVVEAVERRLREGRLTIVCADPRFGERARALYGRGYPPDRIRVILADERDRIAELDRREPIFLTTGAHRRVGDLPNPILVPLSLSISPESANELALALIHLNMKLALEPETR